MANAGQELRILTEVRENAVACEIGLPTPASETSGVFEIQINACKREHAEP